MVFEVFFLFADKELEFVNFILKLAILFVCHEEVRSNVLIFGFGSGILLLLFQLILLNLVFKLLDFRLLSFHLFIILLLLKI